MGEWAGCKVLVAIVSLAAWSESCHGPVGSVGTGGPRETCTGLVVRPAGLPRCVTGDCRERGSCLGHRRASFPSKAKQSCSLPWGMHLSAEASSGWDLAVMWG